MDSKDLFARLAREGINPLAYRLETIGEGDGADGYYSLCRNGSSWEVGYVERDSRDILGTFATEDAACDDLFERLDKETSARSHLLASFQQKADADDLASILLRAGIEPTHRDAPAITHRSDIRHRIFVDGRDLEAARKIRDRHAGAKTG